MNTYKNIAKQNKILCTNVLRIFIINSDAQMSTFQSLYTIKVIILSVEHVWENKSPDLL